MGLLLRLGHESIQHLTQFNYHAFFTLLLPPIILDSGYSMKKRHFFRNFGSIVAFAVAGTIISTAVVSLGLLILGWVGLSYTLPISEAFMYGSLISAVDPVATLAVFAHVGAPDQLNSILAGESILNDAVAIVLYRYDPATVSSRELACLLCFVFVCFLSLVLLLLLCGAARSRRLRI